MAYGDYLWDVYDMDPEDCHFDEFESPDDDYLWRNSSRNHLEFYWGLYRPDSEDWSIPQRLDRRNIEGIVMLLNEPTIRFESETQLTEAVCMRTFYTRNPSRPIPGAGSASNPLQSYQDVWEEEEDELWARDTVPQLGALLLDGAEHSQMEFEKKEGSISPIPVKSWQDLWADDGADSDEAIWEKEPIEGLEELFLDEADDSFREVEELPS